VEASKFHVEQVCAYGLLPASWAVVLPDECYESKKWLSQSFNGKSLLEDFNYSRWPMVARRIKTLGF